MKIDTGASALYAAQRASPSAAAGAARKPASAAADDERNAAGTAAGARSDAGAAASVDFSRMTRQDLREWVNAQLSQGKLSLDDSFPFMAMTLKMPVSGGTGEVPAETDGERMDFRQHAQDGLAFARANNDTATMKMLQSALRIMGQQQGQGLDLRA
ncbi:hypothetical protein LZ017_01165 [Pelomonas sp. CA6]|uniref:hypothetical protein n=1 Tax=Pelomonas sp. CA6 TaxID=2907999 RepID=UPI001F4A5F85|nr:hypothetical protein [Pelomonas sp. CA6]MCH7341997.1 hypothetical protein [Pelomonas sp. CA6]